MMSLDQIQNLAEDVVGGERGRVTLRIASLITLAVLLILATFVAVDAKWRMAKAFEEFSSRVEALEKRLVVVERSVEELQTTYKDISVDGKLPRIIGDRLGRIEDTLKEQKTAIAELTLAINVSNALNTGGATFLRKSGAAPAASPATY